MPYWSTSASATASHFGAPRRLSASRSPAARSGPPLFESMVILGRDEVTRRIAVALRRAD